MSRAFRADDAGPNEKVVAPSDLVEGVLGLLEEAGVPTEINDKIVNLIEDWDRQKATVTAQPSLTSHGNYRFPDGSFVARPHTLSKNRLELPFVPPADWKRDERWIAMWADGTPLTSDNDEVSLFDTEQDAFKALEDGGEGPGAGR